MSPSTTELFSEVCKDILMHKSSFTSRDFLEHPDLQDMNYKTCKMMLRNFLTAQVKIGKIAKVSKDGYVTLEK
jgi:hypothetical protein